MSSEIAGAVQSIRLLMDVLKANKSLTNFNELVAAVSEANADLLSAQAIALTSQKHEMTLSEEVRELKQKIVTLENWDREAERYHLAEISPGVFAYSLKSGMEQNEPAHYLCANCFAQGKKSILQFPATSHRVNFSTCGREVIPESVKNVSQAAYPLG